MEKFYKWGFWVTVVLIVVGVGYIIYDRMQWKFDPIKGTALPAPAAAA